MNKLNLVPIDSHSTVTHPMNFGDLTLESEAIEVLSDFTQISPVVLNAGCAAELAERLMKNMHIQSQIVVDGGGEMVGLVCLQDLSGPELVKKVASGYRRDELVVEDLMKRRHDLIALSYGEVARATVGELVESLRDHHQSFCLVLEAESSKVRGLISAHDIARRLFVPLNVAESITFDELFNKVRRIFN